jgi:hypothetical protein
MKNHLLFFISLVLLLFTLLSPNRPVKRMACAVNMELKETDGNQTAKRPCTKKCLKHQTHSEPQQAATVVVDCGQHFYAVVSDKELDKPALSIPDLKLAIPASKEHSSPFLESEPDPPRFS